MFCLCNLVFQIQEGEDYRVLISPLPPLQEEKEEEEVKQETAVKTQKKVVQKKVEKKVVKVEVKGIDNRSIEKKSLHSSFNKLFLGI